MTQPAPARGIRVIEIGIPICYDRQVEFESALAPMAHEYTEMYSPDINRNWYQIVDNTANRRLLTGLILQFPEILTRSAVNRVDPAFYEQEGGSELGS